MKILKLYQLLKKVQLDLKATSLSFEKLGEQKFEDVEDVDKVRDRIRWFCDDIEIEIKLLQEAIEIIEDLDLTIQ